MIVILFIVGLLLLIFGAEMLVKAASRIVLALKISPLVVDFRDYQLTQSLGIVALIYILFSGGLDTR